MNQGKLDVIKQEMTRVNICILGISELKWWGMGEFNSDDHYIYYCGQKSLRRNGVALIVNKRVLNSVLGCNLKMTEWFLFVSKANHYITVIQVYAPNTTAEELQVEWFCVLLMIGDWNTKTGNQEIPGVTGKFGLRVWPYGRKVRSWPPVSSLYGK